MDDQTMRIQILNNFISKIVLFQQELMSTVERDSDLVYSSIGVIAVLEEWAFNAKNYIRCFQMLKIQGFEIAMASHTCCL